MAAAEMATGGGYGLMIRAAHAVAAEALRRFPGMTGVSVLCGPGNNGGDGYAAASILKDNGVAVKVFAEDPPRPGSHAAQAAGAWRGTAAPLARFRPEPGILVVDALYGAGLSRPLEGWALAAALACREFQADVLAVDMPSGVSGDSGLVLGEAFAAGVTVSFQRKRPGHLLLPGRNLCGDVVIADIGIPDRCIEALDVLCAENGPPLFTLPQPAPDAHKYSRGHVAVFSGGLQSTGAARLAAFAAQRAGAGAVTLVSPASAMAVNAAHLTSIMLAEADDIAGLANVLGKRRHGAFVIGPGFAPGDKLRGFVLALLAGPVATLVLDADVFTAFADDPVTLFAAIAGSACAVILTPHESEFARLFGIGGDWQSKVDRARDAAKTSGAVIVLKGPDTVIAAPDGRAAINANASAFLATAGSGDVLAGTIAGLAAQGMTAFEAACAGVWLHGESGTRLGAGLIAEDLPGVIGEIAAEAAR